MLPFFQQHEMAPKRTPLRVILGNRGRGPDTSRYTRGKITSLYTAGLSQRQIVDVMKRSRDAIRGAIALKILNTNGVSLPRSGRPRVYNN